MYLLPLGNSSHASGISFVVFGQPLRDGFVAEYRSCDVRVTSFCSLDLKIKGAMSIMRFPRDHGRTLQDFQDRAIFFSR